MKTYVLLVILMTFLFLSSSQTYEQQSLIPLLQNWLSNKPLESLLSSIHFRYGDTIISIETLGYYHFIEFFIRKGAHFVIFGLVGLAFYRIFKNTRVAFFAALLCTLSCAIADEYHQALTGGRTSSLKDVLLDLSGGSIFILLVYYDNKHKKGFRKA